MSTHMVSSTPGAINPNKAKVRVVYDAAAEYGGTSLNKELL